MCRHCGRAADDRHACHDREVADLPLGGRKTQLVVRARQFRRRDCGKFFTPRPPALAEGSDATARPSSPKSERFLARLADPTTHADVSAAARFFGVPEKTAERWYYDYLERRQQDPPNTPEPVRSLGVDEPSTKKLGRQS